MFFCLHGTNGGDNATIRDFPTGWHLVFCNEKAGASTSGHVSANALCEASQFICKGLEPYVAVGAVDKMAVLLDFASGGIGDRFGFIGDDIADGA